MSSPDDNGSAPGDTVTRAQPSRRFALGSLSKTTLALFAVVGLATVAAGGTYAYLNSVASISDAVTITAGTASLHVDGALTGMTALYPGVTTYGTAAMNNDGDVALALAAAATSTDAPALTSAVTLKIGVVQSADLCQAGFAGTSATFGGSAVAFDAVGIVAPGTTKYLCVAVTLPMNAPNASQSQAANFSLAINGTQAN